ncbi:hypothetical protein SJS40_02090, partial [Aeromonas caviae]|uniref:hypothetical protein n=1 Tax=Aeromonas caviae TaxID=648 RepID=UPI0029D66CEC
PLIRTFPCLLEIKRSHEKPSRISPSAIWGTMKGGRSWQKCPQDFSFMNKRAPLPEYIMAPPHATLQITMTTDLS